MTMMMIYLCRRAPADGAPEEFEATRIASARANRSAISWARKDNASTTSPGSTTAGSISSMLQVRLEELEQKEQQI